MSEESLAPQPIAIWNDARGAWEMPNTENLLCEHWELWLQPWPLSGMATMLDGKLSVLPMQAHRIDESASSLSDSLGGGQELMPTPLTTSGRGFSNPEVEAGNPKKRLVAEVEVLRRSETQWGKFEPVIRKWEEIMGRPAPEPTQQLSEDKRHELNPVFVEWMMSLPEGWVTGHGLSAMEELKILGNGVAPLQAALALRLLLGLEKPTERERERELIPTPTVFHVSMHNEPIETFLNRQAKSSTGQIGKSLGVALRMELGE